MFSCNITVRITGYRLHFKRNQWLIVTHVPDSKDNDIEKHDSRLLELNIG